MSIKEEVNNLTTVYSLLRENFEGGVNVGVETGLPNPLTSTTSVEDNNLDSIDDSVPDVQMSDSEAIITMTPMHSVGEDNKDMAKSELYKLVKAGSQLLQMLMEGSCIKIEPWQLSKITKASDYICAVKNSIEFDEFEKMAGEMVSGLSELNSPIVSKVKNMLAGEPMEVNEEVLRQVIFNIECLKEAKSVEDKKTKVCQAAKKGCKCNKCLKCKANQKRK